MSDSKITASTPSDITTDSPQSFDVHFVKSSQFRVVHASGVWYGGDAQGNLHLTFFNERSPLPKKIVVKVNPKGEVIGEDEAKRESKHGFVREMEVDVMMSLQAALDLYNSLGENLRSIQKNQENLRHAQSNSQS